MNTQDMYDHTPEDLIAEDLLLEIQYEADQIRRITDQLNQKNMAWPDPYPFVTYNLLCENSNQHYFRWRELTREARLRYLVFEETIFDFENAPANEPAAVK